MSLDVHLTAQERDFDCTCECGHVHTRKQREELYWRNITHNLGKMAAEAGLYHALWHPEESGWTKAGQLVAPLKSGLALLKSDRTRFEAYNAPNGWGVYQDLVDFVEDYLKACENYPDADVTADR